MIEFEVYDTDLNLLGVLDNYESCLWKSRFYEAGCFEIVATADENNLYLLKKYSFIVKDDDVGFIDTFLIKEDENGEVITVSGVLSVGIINREIRNVKSTLSDLINANCVDVEEGRKVPLLSLGEIEDIPITASSVKNRDLGEVLNEISKVHNIGFKLTADVQNKNLVLSTFKSYDRSINQTENPQEVFSEEFDNLLSSEYITSDVGSFNVIRAVAKVSSGTFYYTLPTFILGEAEGFHRREKVVEVDAETYTLSYTTQGGETINQTWVDQNATLTKMKEACYATITGITENFTADVMVLNYSERAWDIGDIVTVQSLKWGISVNVRIGEIEEFYNHAEDKVCVTFGSPIKIK